MERRKLGRTGPEVSALGLGCMGMSDFHGALDVTLSAKELAAVDAAAPEGAIAGTRYHATQMAMLDSERT